MKCLKLNSEKKQALAMRLPSYKPISVFIRFVFISVIAIVLMRFIASVFEKSGWGRDDIPFKMYLVTIVSFNILAELQIVLDNILERFFPVPQKIRLRIFIQLVFGILFLAITHRCLILFTSPDLVDAKARPGVVMGMLAGLLFVQLMASSLTTARLTQKWLDMQDQIAGMKREKLQMDYLSLQDQLNPHFLFNNLSVLKSLIVYDQEKALEFTENFTDVYRYVLQSKEKRLVKLSEEFEFLEAYFNLHKERLGEGIRGGYSISETSLDKEIAPLTGQLLVENAIKHNITSREKPLEIHIETSENWFIVSNTLNLKSSTYSTKTGLKNLIKRYEMLTEKEIVIQYDENRFEVKVPLL